MDHAADRRTASRSSVHGRPDAARHVDSRGRFDWPTPCGDADETHGDRGNLSSSEHQQTRAGPQDIPLSVAQAEDRTAQPCLGDGHRLHPDDARLRLSGGGGRLGDPAGSFASRVDHDGGGFLRRGVGGSLGQIRQAGDIQHGSRQPVHGRGVHRRADEERHRHQHGRQGIVARQRVRRAAVAQREIRGSLSAGLWRRRRGPLCDHPLSGVLQPRIRTPICLCD